MAIIDTAVDRPVPSATPAPGEASGADPLFTCSSPPGGLVEQADGTLFVSDPSAGIIWQVSADGSGAPATVAPRTPAGLALAPDGTLFFADSAHHRIWARAADGSLRLVAGAANGVLGYRDGPAAEALFRSPRGVALGADGTCYVADTENDRIRAITPDGVVTTVAGAIYNYRDGHGSTAGFRRPEALDVDPDGIVYVADTGNNAIRRITPDGAVSTLAGGPPGGDHDGQGPMVGLRWPSGIAVDRHGSLWVADHGNGVVRRVSATGESTTMLRLTGGRRPNVVALRGDGTALVAGTASDPLLPGGWVLTIGG